MLQTLARLAACLLGLTSLFVLSNNSFASSAAPDFTNVADILGGRRTLFPVDDLVATYQHGSDPVSAQVAFTENGGFGDSYIIDLTNGADDFATGIGRMFNLPYDVTVAITTGAITIYDAVTHQQYEFPIAPVVKPNLNQFAQGDYTGDGYDDFAFILDNSIYVVTAKNPDNLVDGIFVSPALTPSLDFHDKWVSLAGGDFGGFGSDQLALAVADGDTMNVLMYTVTPAYDVDHLVTDLTFEPIGNTNYTAFGSPIEQVYLTAGNFGDVSNPDTAIAQEQLVLAYGYPVHDGHEIELAVITAELVSQVPPTFQLDVRDQNGDIAFVASDRELLLTNLTHGYIDFFGDTEQFVVAWAAKKDNSDINNYMNVEGLDSDLNLTELGNHEFGESSLIRGIALGNMDDTDDPSQLAQLELGVLANQYQFLFDETTPLLKLYHIDPTNNFEFHEYASEGIGLDLIEGGPEFNMSLVAGDAQGRSFFLGPPTTVTVQHDQPQIILGMPPMHVDYTTPANQTTPQVLNLSAVPDGFDASYATTQTKTDQSSQTHTTSYTHSLKEQITAGYKYSIPAVASISSSLTVSSGQMWKNNVSKQYSSFNTLTFDASTNTGFDDQVWFTNETHKLYVYPVIGHYACPEDNPSCDDSEKLPVNVTFSGPTVNKRESGAGAMLEWYQPVQEPGNVFSYPWDLEQLQALIPNQQLLTSANPTGFSTDGSTLTASANWQSGNSNAVTSGSTNDISWGSSLSVSASGPKLGGATGSLKLSYNGSKSVSTLNTSTTTMGASTGIGISMKGSFPSPDQYAYPIAPFILGQTPVQGTWQQIPLDVDVTTTGILQSAFTADPYSGGAWWQQAYMQPDIALNHPARWTISEEPATDSGPACIPTNANDNIDCATFNAPGSDIWTSQFYWMKGLYITPADSAGDGPQITQIDAGDPVLLETRVYNYSFANLANDSTPIVQFYGQPWDTTTQTPVGNSFLIDTVELPTFGGFPSGINGNEDPNWVMAQTTNLDTAAYADQFLVFWVVVWMQDSQGNMIAEPQLHGLTQTPPTFTSISDAVPYLQTYSNNLGVYKVPFYIAPVSSQRQQAAKEAHTAGHLRMDTLKLSKQTVLLHDKVEVSANVRTDDAMDGLDVLFYDGNPDKRGTLFEMEGIPHIRANEKYQVRTLYQPKSCGTHNLYLELQPGGIRAQTSLNVTINPKQTVKQLRKQFKQLGLNSGRAGGGYAELLNEAKKAFKDKNIKAGLDALEQVKTRVENQRGNKIPDAQAGVMLAVLKQVFTCVKA